MLVQPQSAGKVEFLTYEQGQPLPVERLIRAIYSSLRSRRRDKVAVMGDREALEKLKPVLDAEELDLDANFQWSGPFHRYQLKRRWKRVMLGDYEAWFRWYMRYQRFKAFHVVVMIEPQTALAGEELGGYLDGFLARLVGKVPHKVIMVQTAQQTQANAPDNLYIQETLLAMLYGTRLSFDELAATARLTFIQLGDGEALRKLMKERWLWRRDHSRYQLTETGEEFIEGITPPKPHREEEPSRIKPLFQRRRRSEARYSLPKDMLAKMLIDDARENGWVTAYGEWLELSERLGRLARKEGSIIWDHFWGKEVSHREVEQALAPSPRLLRGILDEMAAKGRLEKASWFREVGRPTEAYFPPGKSPFFAQRCGQCAFYVTVRRRCRLWWLVNKKQVFYDERWKQEGSPVTRFEVHKMRHASRIGPHSSACPRFIDKKRDHLRKEVPERCEVCDEAVRRGSEGVAVTCQRCRTRYVRFRDKVKVMTAYEHEYGRLYHEVTGGDAETDLEKWKKEMRERLPNILKERTDEDDLDVLAEEVEAGSEPTRARPQFDQALQEKVDRLAQTSDMARRLSLAMAQSALNATRRIIAIAKLREGDVGQAAALQEKYITIINDAGQSRLLTYEALVMKQYWFCYGLALQKAQQWFGPRKKSRFVTEFVEDPAGRARGYSALDAAINYLHQRRLRQAERINAEVGFPGTCDGFLHGERHNSRKIGLLLDMIDPFKFADREELMVVALNGGISWRDFRLERDRRGSTFYYPSGKGESILNQIGADADNLEVWYQGHQTHLTEAFREFAPNLLQVVNDNTHELTILEPFEFRVAELR